MPPATPRPEPPLPNFEPNTSPSPPPPSTPTLFLTSTPTTADDEAVWRNQSSRAGLDRHGSDPFGAHTRHSSTHSMLDSAASTNADVRGSGWYPDPNGSNSSARGDAAPYSPPSRPSPMRRDGGVEGGSPLDALQAAAAKAHQPNGAGGSATGSPVAGSKGKGPVTKASRPVWSQGGDTRLELVAGWGEAPLQSVVTTQLDELQGEVRSEGGRVTGTTLAAAHTAAIAEQNQAQARSAFYRLSTQRSGSASFVESQRVPNP